MVCPVRTEPFFQRLEAEHRNWLSCFDSRYLSNWERLLNGDEESAFAEARVRQLLDDHRVVVQPNEDIDGGKSRPDFCCTARGNKFYVEVTCIPDAVATKDTGSPDAPHGFSWFRPLSDAIFEKCRGKAAQCANLDGPALVAIGTFHRFAAMGSFKKPVLNWVLTGEPKISWNIDVRTGKQVGETRQITELRSAAFLHPSGTMDVGYARSSISGLLLTGLTLSKRPFIGLLHPNPVRPFDPTTMPQVEFGELMVDDGAGSLRVSWPRGDDE